MARVNELDAYWQFLLDNMIATEEELQLVTSINGYSKETLDDILYACTGNRSKEQYCDENGIECEEESKGIRSVTNKILEGVPVREAILDDEVPAESVTASEDFIDSAKKFSSYLLRTYPFISKVEPDIRFETKYISNFFIEVETNISYYIPEKSISEFGLNNLIQGEKVYYGAGDDIGEVEYSIESVGRDLSDLFYKDALKFDLVPVKTNKSYSIMTYSKESYYYSISNIGDSLHLRLEFYTDIGLADNK